MQNRNFYLANVLPLMLCAVAVAQQPSSLPSEIEGKWVWPQHGVSKVFSLSAIKAVSTQAAVANLTWWTADTKCALRDVPVDLRITEGKIAFDATTKCDVSFSAELAKTPAGWKGKAVTKQGIVVELTTELIDEVSGKSIPSYAAPGPKAEDACSAALGRPCASISDYVRIMPLFDAHNHLQHDVSVEMLNRWMDAAGVRRMVLIPRHYRDDGRASDEQGAQYAQQFPGRFVAFIGGQRDDLWQSRAWYQMRSDYLSDATTKVQSNKYRGLGEFIIRHYGYNRYVRTTDQSVSGDESLSLDTPLMANLFELGLKSRLPVLIHAEAEPEMQKQMRYMLEKWPATQVVWAHNCGRAPAEQVASFLKAYPQLICDLAGMSVPFPRPFGWGVNNTSAGIDYKPNSHVTRIQENDGTINPSMRDLFESFPDRFMIGTDTAHPFQYSRYGDVIVAFRRLLSQLDPATASKIGYENAERVFGTPPLN